MGQEKKKRIENTEIGIKCILDTRKRPYIYVMWANEKGGREWDSNSILRDNGQEFSKT